MNRTRSWILLATLLAASPARGEVVARDLGTLGGDWSVATAINAAGHVVGGSLTANGEYHAFVWTPERGMVDLGTLGGTFSQARGIDPLGRVVGVSTLPPDDISGDTYRAFVWDHGKLQDLGSPSSFTWSSTWAEAINGSGQVVGAAPFGGLLAFRWTEQEGFVNLGVTDRSHAYAISDLGTVVGSFNARWWGSYSDSPDHAFVWKDGVVRDLGTAPNHKFSWAYGVNDAEQIVGCSRSGDLITVPAFVALLWSGDSAAVILENACARAINDHAQVVGEGPGGAFLWSAAEGAVTLPGPGGNVSLAAYALNDRGDVVGASWTGPQPGATAHATLWTVPTTPAGGDQGIPALIAQVQGLVDAGVLADGQGKALRSKLEAAGVRLADAQPEAAAGVLRAFQLQVEAFVRAGVLSAALGDPLVAGAAGVVVQ